MSYYPDLSRYCYFGSEFGPHCLNIGWLSPDYEFPTGEVPASFLETLTRLSRSPINCCKGFHHCEFCPRPVRTKTAVGLPCYAVNFDSTGNGEIHVPGLDGITYAAPLLILHYIAVHKYQPPQAYIDAVMRCG